MPCRDHLPVCSPARSGGPQPCPTLSLSILGEGTGREPQSSGLRDIILWRYFQARRAANSNQGRGWSLVVEKAPPGLEVAACPLVLLHPSHLPQQERLRDSPAFGINPLGDAISACSCKHMSCSSPGTAAAQPRSPAGASSGWRWVVVGPASSRCCTGNVSLCCCTLLGLQLGHSLLFLLLTSGLK